MPQLAFRFLAGGTAALYLAQVRDLETVATSEGAFLLASSGTGGGLTSLRLAEGAAPTLVAQMSLRAADDNLVPVALSAGVIGGRLLLLTSGERRFGRVVLSETGNLTPSGTQSWQATPAQGFLLPMGDRLFLYATAMADGSLTAFNVTSGLAVQPVATHAATGAYDRDLVAFAAATLAGGTFLVGASGSGDGLTVFQVDPVSGVPRLVGGFGAAEGIGINAPTALGTARIAGHCYLLVAGAGSSSLTVFELSPSGGLRPVDHVIDTLATRFGSAAAMAVVEHRGRVYLLAGGGDDGLSLLTLLPDGTLVALQSLADTAQATLDNVAAIAALMVGSELQVLVTSQTEPGLSFLRLSLAGQGETLALAAGGTLAGGALDDLLTGSDQADSLSGGAGEDLILDGGGADLLTGGSGADLFILSADGATDRISDFQPGLDRLDLSRWAMLYAPGQLGFRATASGAVLSWRGEELLVDSADGRSLTLAQIFPGSSFGLPDRPPMWLNAADPIHGTPGPDVLRGDILADRILGFDANDTLLGAAGNDTLIGGGGDDRIYGEGDDDLIYDEGGRDLVDAGSGDDTVMGGLGRDRYALGAGHDRFVDIGEDGAEGADTIDASAGNDSIIAGGGNDRISGGNDADLIYGGAGDDLIYGDAGDDTILGGTGNDSVHGSNGRDLVWLDAGDDAFYDTEQAGRDGVDEVHGGEGRDRILARGGDDTLWGDGGNDLLEGGSGADLLDGGAGDDRLAGGTEADRLWGGQGHDTLEGGAGRDMLDGGEGDDRLGGGNDGDWLVGGPGHDLIYGDAGDDTIFGGTGNDSVHGSNGRDVVWLDAGDDGFYDTDEAGPAGADVVHGGNGRDLIRARGGDDLLWGDNDDDTIEGGAGNDTLDGGAGADWLFGGAGDDRIFGGSGGDLLHGDAGDDPLNAGGGADSLRGGAGADLLTGGAGADIFVFAPGDGVDRIVDFAPAEDLIRFEGGLRWQDLAFSAIGAGCQLNYGSGLIVLEEVTPAMLGPACFEFF